MRRNETGDRYFEYIKGLFDHDALAFLPSIRDKHALDVIQTLATQVVYYIAGFGASIIIARTLGPEGRGQYYLALTVAALVAQFGSLGLHFSNVYLVARNSSLSRQLTANSSWVALLVGIFAFSVLEGLRGLNWHSQMSLSMSALTALRGAAVLLVILGTNLLIGSSRVGLFNGAQLSNSLFGLAAVTIAALLGLEVEGFFAAGVLVAIAVGALSLTALSWGQPIVLSFDSRLFVAGLRLAAKAYVIALLGFLTLRMNVFLVQTFKGSEVLGYYSVASQIGEVLGLFPTSLGLLLFPRLVRDEQGRYRSMQRHLGAVAIVMALLCTGVGLLAEPLVRVAFGAAFAPSVPMLRWLLPGAFLFGLTTMVSQYLAALGFPVAVVLIWLAGLLCMAGLGWFLTPLYGGSGAAMALSMSCAVVFLLELWLARAMRHTELRNPNAYAKSGRGALMGDYAIIGSSLTRQFRKRIERALGGEPQYVSLSELRRLPFLKLWKTLRSLKGERVFVAIEDDSMAMLPALLGVAALTKTSCIEIVRPTLQRERIGRIKAMLWLLHVGIATLQGGWAVLACWMQLRRLINADRIPVVDAKAGVLYLKTNFWFGVRVGGSVGHINGVVNGLARRAYSVMFASTEPPDLVDHDVNFLPVRPPRVYGFPPELNLYRFQKSFVGQVRSGLDHGPTGVIYHRLSLGNYAGVILSRYFRIPLILEYNGSEVWVAKNWSRPLQFQRLALLAEDVSLKHAHLVVTVSEVLKEELIQRGVDPERIVTYPNCVDPHLFNPERFKPADIAAIRQELGVPTDAVVVTFIGTFGQWHGLDVLANAILRVVDQEEEWLRAKRVHFLLVGDGSQRPLVERTLAHPRYKPFYTLSGLVPQSEAPGCLAASDILVSPHVPNPDGSRFFGSPTKLFEYMAMGKGIVASDLEQIGTVLQSSIRVGNLPIHQESPKGEYLSVLVEPGEVDDLLRGIKFLVENPAWRLHLGRNARRESLLHYTWDKHVGAILDGLNSIVLNKK